MSPFLAFSSGRAFALGCICNAPLWARYMQPDIGRFILPDSIVPHPSDPRDHSRYTYPRNNPLKYIEYQIFQLSPFEGAGRISKQNNPTKYCISSCQN